MAYFGGPKRTTTTPSGRRARASRSSTRSSKLKKHRSRPKLAARVGIDSGTVVVGAGAGKDTDVFGETPNISARVQAAAVPDTVLITADTHRLVSGLFAVEESGGLSAVAELEFAGSRDRPPWQAANK